MPVNLGSPRPIVWIGSSRQDLRAFPAPIRRAFGLALFAVQCGDTPPIAKPLKGLGTGVLELIEHSAGGTYRAVYAVRFRSAVYVLHAFQKKSKAGRATPPREIELIKRRLKRANELDADKDESDEA
jgi:phage-related protein